MEISTRSRYAPGHLVSTPSIATSSPKVREARELANGGENSYAQQRQEAARPRERDEPNPIRVVAHANSISEQFGKLSDYGSMDSHARMAIRAYMEQQNAPLLDESTALTQIVGVDYFV